jgi:outer membrane protein W
MILKKTLSLLFVSFIGFLEVKSQSYLENKSKYHFAQGAMGVDFQYISRTGITHTLQNGLKKEYQFGGFAVPKVVIGGLHFWGHADIAFSISVGEIGKKTDSIAINYSDFDIMTFKYYPWAVQKNKIRPYIGTAANLNTFAQQGTGEFKRFYSGKDHRFNMPLNVGLSYQKGNWLLNADMKYNLNRERTIYASRTETTSMTLPSYSLAFGIRRLFESTAPKFEKRSTDGRMKKDYEDNQHKLNAFSFGIGASTSIQTGSSEYNNLNRKFISKRPGTVFPELGIGYYLNKPDMQFNLVYRNLKGTESGYGIFQQFSRQAITLEAYKFLFDYKGFVPFLGLGIGKENLSFYESDKGVKTVESVGSTISPNLTFGWDIRYHRLNWFMLRTNMRYYPMLKLDSKVGKINFNQLEMNFIQAVIYPQRLKFAKSKPYRKNN